MATEELLDEAEFDALKKAAASDKVAAPSASLLAPGEPVETYDLGGLEQSADEGQIDPDIVYERFEREFRATLLKNYRTSVEVKLESNQISSFGDLRASLEVPASINQITTAPLRSSTKPSPVNVRSTMLSSSRRLNTAHRCGSAGSLTTAISTPAPSLRCA